MLRQLRRWRGRLPDGTLGQWTLTSKETAERTFCIHEHGLPHGLCQYPCPYMNYKTLSYMESLDLSDISDYEDYIVTFSDEEIPGIEEVPYWYRTLVCLNICFIKLLLDYSISWQTLPSGVIPFILWIFCKRLCAYNLFLSNMYCNDSYHHYITLQDLVEVMCWNIKLISEHSVFPLVIVSVWQWGAWKHAPM